ncbi:hypothetical protein D3C80_661220 [compost metagenome]
MQAGQGLVLTLQLVFHLPGHGPAGSSGGEQVGVGQLQHQAGQQPREVAQALVDALLAEGVGQHLLVVFGRVVPGRAAGDRRVVGLLVAVQLAQLPVGRFDEQHRHVEVLETFTVAAAAGAGRVRGVEARVGEQRDVHLLGDAQQLVAVGTQGRVGNAVAGGVGVHLVAGDQAVEVDHAQQVGALAVAQ